MREGGGDAAYAERATERDQIELDRLPRSRVVDKTGLTGGYDFRLDFAQPPVGSGTTPGSQIDRGPSIFSALQEKLGLRLEPKKGPVEFLVIHQANKVPTEN